MVTWRVEGDRTWFITDCRKGYYKLLGQKWLAVRLMGLADGDSKRHETEALARAWLIEQIEQVKNDRATESQDAIA